MNNRKFLQLHWLASYPGTLLNRDDAGLAKRLSFGGKTRARISSQCLKRHWRLAGAENLQDAATNPWALQNLDIPGGVRTKDVLQKRVIPLAKEQVVDVAEEIIEIVEDALLIELYGDKAKESKNRQALFFGDPEIEYLAGLAAKAFESEAVGKALSKDKKLKKDGEKELKKLFKEHRANLRALKNGAGLGASLFGRMVTSDPAANTDAAIHVAHALSVHAIERELDYMTVVDDLKNIEEGDDAGAAGVFDMELTSGLYYGFAVVDVPLLVSNLSADSEMAAKVCEHLVHLIAQVSPGAKKGSTAPYAWAENILVEIGSRQPRTLANAFRDAVDINSPHLQMAACEKMSTQLEQLDAAYGNGEARHQLAVNPDACISNIEASNLDTLGAWSADRVRESVAP